MRASAAADFARVLQHKKVLEFRAFLLHGKDVICLEYDHRSAVSNLGPLDTMMGPYDSP